MTNTEIIIREAVAHNLYTMDEVEKIIAAGRDINLHTYSVWKENGYQVKKGQHAAITTSLWKHAAEKKNKKGETVAAHYYLAKAFLFTADQVEKITQ